MKKIIIMSIALFFIASGNYSQYILGKEVYMLVNPKTSDFYKENKVKKIVSTETDYEKGKTEIYEFEFDENGNIIRVILGHNEFTIKYIDGKLSNIKRYNLHLNKLGYDFNFNWDKFDQLENCVDNETGEIIYNYECTQSGYVTKIINYKTTKWITDISYNNNHQIDGITENVSSSEDPYQIIMLYDDNDRLTEVRNKYYVQNVDYGENNLMRSWKIYKKKDTDNLYKEVIFTYDFY